MATASDEEEGRLADIKERLAEDAESFADEVAGVDAEVALGGLLSRLGISREHLTSTEPTDGRCETSATSGSQPPLRPTEIPQEQENR